jgi:hypothetical protein
MAKRLKEEKLQQDLRDKLTKLKVTLSLIPRGCTSYVQVLDVLINKLIKAYIKEYNVTVRLSFRLSPPVTDLIHTYNT